MKDGEKLLSIKELAYALGRTEKTVYRMQKKGAPIFGGRGYLSEVREWQKSAKRK